MSTVNDAWKLVSDRKLAMCDGPVPRSLDANDVLRHLASGTGLSPEDLAALKRYVDVAGSHTIHMALAGAPLNQIVGGIIADAFITGYHARRLEEEQDR